MIVQVGHENTVNDHHQQNGLMVKQILPTSFIRNYGKQEGEYTG